MKRQEQEQVKRIFVLHVLYQVLILYRGDEARSGRSGYHLGSSSYDGGWSRGLCGNAARATRTEDRVRAASKRGMQATLLQELVSL